MLTKQNNTYCPLLNWENGLLPEHPDSQPKVVDGRSCGEKGLLLSIYNKRSNCSHLKPPRPVPRCLWIDYSTTPFVCMTNGTFMTVDTANGCNTNKLHVSFKITLNRQLWWQMYGGNWFLRPQTWRPNHNIRMMATALCPCVQAPYLVVLPGDWLLGKWYVLPWTDTDKSWIRNKR